MENTGQQTPEPGWPAWADTPAKRERNQRVQAQRNERIRAAEQASTHGIKVTVTFWRGRQS